MTQRFVPSGANSMGLDDGTPSDEVLDLEFAYTTWADSCRNLFHIDQCCRRPDGHDDNHAAGYGASRRRWQE